MSYWWLLRRKLFPLHPLLFTVIFGAKTPHEGGKGFTYGMLSPGFGSVIWKGLLFSNHTKMPCRLAAAWHAKIEIMPVSIHLSVHPSIYPPIHPLHQPLTPPTHLPIYPSTDPSTHQPTHPSIHPSISLLIFLGLSLSHLSRRKGK